MGTIEPHGGVGKVVSRALLFTSKTMNLSGRSAVDERGSLESGTPPGYSLRMNPPRFRLLSALRSKSQRELAIVVLAIITTLGAGIWTIFVYLFPQPSPSPSSTTNDAANPVPQTTPVNVNVSSQNGIAIGGDVINSQLSVEK
ncbi:MAG: hypothetical protein V4574_18730 [Pseudomonadota bacterium]